jgi:hypothetical protein
MKITEINTENGNAVQEFIDFPKILYADCPQWVPMLEMDARAMMDRKKHPFYTTSDAAFFIARNEAAGIVGRMAIIENKPYNNRSGKQRAFFYLFDVINEPAVAKALFERGEGWAKARGLNEIFGPKGFAALNGLGMLTRGFEHRPAFGIPYNFDYYPELIEKLGFVKEREVLSGHLHRDQEIPEKIRIIAEKVQERFGLRVDTYRTRKDLKRMLPHIKDLYNGSLVGTSGNAPLTDEDVQAMARTILMVADPNIIKVLMKGEKAVGFLLAYPDVSAALQKTGGKLFPFGWIRILRELKRTTWININGAGIIDEYRGLGGTAVLFNEMGKSVKTGRYQHVDLVQIGVENEKMRRELSAFGIDFYKSHCMYSKMID